MLSTKITEKLVFRKNNFYKDPNPSHLINFSKFTRSLENIRSNELKQCFKDKIL